MVPSRNISHVLYLNDQIDIAPTPQQSHVELEVLETLHVHCACFVRSTRPAFSKLNGYKDQAQAFPTSTASTFKKTLNPVSGMCTGVVSLSTGKDRHLHLPRVFDSRRRLLRFEPQRCPRAFNKDDPFDFRLPRNIWAPMMVPVAHKPLNLSVRTF